MSRAAKLKPTALQLRACTQNHFAAPCRAPHSLVALRAAPCPGRAGMRILGIGAAGASADACARGATFCSCGSCGSRLIPNCMGLRKDAEPGERFLADGRTGGAPEHKGARLSSLYPCSLRTLCVGRVTQPQLPWPATWKPRSGYDFLCRYLDGSGSCDYVSEWERPQFGSEVAS